MALWKEAETTRDPEIGTDNMFGMIITEPVYINGASTNSSHGKGKWVYFLFCVALWAASVGKS